MTTLILSPNLCVAAPSTERPFSFLGRGDIVNIAMDLLFRDTYLAAIRGSLGSKIFQHSFARIKNKKVDILRGGDLSCAYFVTFILSAAGLIREIHATVDGAIRDLEYSGWTKVEKPVAGCVVVWEPAVQERGEVHKHIGFYMGAGKAISNSSKKKVPAEHHVTFGVKRGKPARNIIATYWHPRLGK